MSVTDPHAAVPSHFPTPEADTPDPVEQAFQDDMNILRPVEVSVEIPGIAVVTQKPLTYFGKLEFFGVLGKALQDIMKSGVSVNDLLASLNVDPETEADMRSGNFDMTTFTSFDNLIQIVSTLATAAPQTIKELYLLALGFDRKDWVAVAPHLDQMDDETGFLILQTFVDQNGNALQDFFAQWWVTVQRLRKA